MEPEGDTWCLDASPGRPGESVISTKKIGFLFCAKNALNNVADTDLLRAELFSIEQLKQHAVMLAGQHPVDPS
ncbi:hypothetical protein, partial [Acidithiobacillus sp.]|uniref:hypothetical protein n=1 Tax=Acidithiobacillus sp. TaxID=1872118 RepID=UPI003D0257B3